MKRILLAIGAAVVAAAPHAALAFDADMALDRFPSSGGRPAVSDSREWRDGRTGVGRSDAVRAYRAGGRDGWQGADRYDRREREWASASDWRKTGRYRSSGSMIDVRTFGGAVERGSFYGTSGTGSGSVIVIGVPDHLDPDTSVRYGGLSGGPKILDVEADRLDRRPYGRNGLAVAHVGTAKIIRIAPDFRRGMDWEVGEREAGEREASNTAPTPFAELPREEQAVTVYPDTDMTERPVDLPAPRIAEGAPPAAAATPVPAPEPAGFLEPWTPNWLRDCVARHPDFDASLGTYTAADGKRRFCTGEP